MQNFDISKRRPSVRHYVAGGTEHGGGIGRLIGYILASSSESEHRVTDTRGPRWDWLRAPPRLLAAMAVMVQDRVVAPQRVHHLHIAGRGSTARKVILGGLARSLGCVHVLHQHDFDYASDFNRRPPWQKRAIRTLFRNADRVVVLGGRDHATAKDLLGAPKNSIEVFHNAVPDPQRPGVTSARTDDDHVRIVFLGQLGPRKGVPELLTALAHPAMHTNGWSAVLAGDGPVDAYRAVAAALGLAGRVTLPGWLDRDQTRSLCEDADILVLPSHGEGMAMAVLEGLAHGLAVVTTRVGAHEEILTDGTTCKFVPVGDPAALALALADLLAHPDTRRRLGRAGRDHYLNTLSIGAYIDKLDTLHRAVTNARVGASPAKRGRA